VSNSTPQATCPFAATAHTPQESFAFKAKEVKPVYLLHFVTRTQRVRISALSKIAGRRGEPNAAP
jgi:hypothetical protein